MPTPHVAYMLCHEQASNIFVSKTNYNRFDIFIPLAVFQLLAAHEKQFSTKSKIRFLDGNRN